jgi:hypothetical protein
MIDKVFTVYRSFFCQNVCPPGEGRRIRKEEKTIFMKVVRVRSVAQGTDRKSDRQIDRQADRQTNRQRDKQKTDKKTNRQIDR